MANYPFIQLHFEDDGSIKELKKCDIVSDSLNFDYKLLSNLKPASNKMTFKIVKECALIEKIINSKKDIKAEISLWDYGFGAKTRIFTGYISNKFTWTVGDHGESLLDVTVEDVGTRLLKKSYEGFTSKIFKGTMTDVLNQICSDAKIIRADAIKVDTPVCMVVEKGKKFEDIIRTLVMECLYTYYFDEYGRLALEDLRFSDVNDYEINKSNLYVKDGKSISLSKSVKQYGSVEVKWNEYETLQKTQIFRDDTGRDEKHPNCYIEVPGNGTYPSKDNGKPANIEVVDLESGKDVVYVENIDPEVAVIGDIHYDITQYNYKSLSVLLTNKSPLEGHIVKLACKGDLTVIKSENTATAGDLGYETLKEDALWLHTEADNKAYAEYLANYYKHCNHTYTFYTDKDMKLGDICRLQDETYTGLDTRVLLTSKKWKLDGLYSYTGVAVAKFDIVDSTNESIQRPSITPGQPGIKGTGIDHVDRFYQAHDTTITPPTTWEKTMPELTPQKKYMWTYSTTFYTDGTSKSTTPGVIGVLGENGVTPVQVSPSFQSYVYPAASNIVEPAEYAAMQCKVTVRQYPDDFTVGNAPLTAKHFYLTATGHGISNVVVDKDIVKTTAQSVMPSYSAYIDVIAHYVDTDDKEGQLAFKINLSKANSGLDGQYVAYEYALSDSREVAPEIGWSNKFPDDLGDRYLWFRQQTVEPGKTIDPKNWSTPRLSEGNINKVYKDMNIVADKIAFNVTNDGKVYPNTPNGAKLEIGTTTDGGYILLDATDVIIPGTITANEINTEDLYSNIIEVGDRIVSGGYREVDGSGNINPRNLPGFYADASGSVKMIDAEIKGTIDSDILTTINGIPEIGAGNIKPEYQSKWNNAVSVRDLKEWYEVPAHQPGMAEDNYSADLKAFNNKFYHKGSYDSYSLYESTDLRSWRKLTDWDVDIIDYQDGMLYAWALDDPTNQWPDVRDHFLAQSHDGSNWSKINTPYIHYYENFTSKLLTPNIWLLLTESTFSGTTKYNYYSTDKGSTWNSLSFFNNGEYREIYGVYGNNKFIVSASLYSHDTPESWRIFDSTDGINWNKIGSIPEKERNNYNHDIKFEGGYFYKIDNTKEGTYIRYSTDGITWNDKVCEMSPLNKLRYIEQLDLWVGISKNYILFSPTIDGTYSATYATFLSYGGASYPAYANNRLGFLTCRRDSYAVNTAYCSNWSRSSITDFFSSIIPKIAPGNRAPTYEPLWDLQSCSGSYTYGGRSGSLSKIKTAPSELILQDTNGSKLVFNSSNSIDAPLSIKNLVIKQIQAIAYLGNVLPKDSNVNLGTNDDRFRNIYAVDVYGNLIGGNVNSESNRLSYKVWGAVAN